MIHPKNVMRLWWTISHLSFLISIYFINYIIILCSYNNWITGSSIHLVPPFYRLTRRQGWDERYPFYVKWFMGSYLNENGQPVRPRYHPWAFIGLWQSCLMGLHEWEPKVDHFKTFKNKIINKYNKFKDNTNMSPTWSERHPHGAFIYISTFVKIKMLNHFQFKWYSPNK